MMQMTLFRAAVSLWLVIGLSACGGSDDPADLTETTSPVTPASVTCDTRQFDPPTGIDEPTSAELATFAKTYTAGASTVILSPTGALSVNGVAIDIKSSCYIPADDMIMISWGVANVVGAGVVYDSFIDFRSAGISGVVDGQPL